MKNGKSLSKILKIKSLTEKFIFLCSAKKYLVEKTNQRNAGEQTFKYSGRFVREMSINIYRNTASGNF